MLVRENKTRETGEIFFWCKSSSVRECGERLYGKVVTTNNHNYHMDCFKCSVCQVALPGKTFFPQGSEVVCAKHVKASGRGMCPKCTEEIVEDYVEADGSKYHPGCFVCGSFSFFPFFSLFFLLSFDVSFFSLWRMCLGFRMGSWSGW